MNIFLVIFSYNILTSSGSVFSIQIIIIPQQRGWKQRFRVYYMSLSFYSFSPCRLEGAQKSRNLTIPHLRKLVNSPLIPSLPETRKNCCMAMPGVSGPINSTFQGVFHSAKLHILGKKIKSESVRTNKCSRFGK